MPALSSAGRRRPSGDAPPAADVRLALHGRRAQPGRDAPRPRRAPSDQHRLPARRRRAGSGSRSTVHGQRAPAPRRRGGGGDRRGARTLRRLVRPPGRLVVGSAAELPGAVDPERFALFLAAQHADPAFPFGRSAATPCSAGSRLLASRGRAGAPARAARLHALAGTSRRRGAHRPRHEQRPGLRRDARRGDARRAARARRA